MFLELVPLEIDACHFCTGKSAVFFTPSSTVTNAMASLFNHSRKAKMSRFARRNRESKTVAAMIAMYCQGHRHGNGDALCPRCARLSEYAARRLIRCVFGDDKPTCAKCAVHCYSAERREEIKVVMKWAGPRMLLNHPLLAISHVLDGRRPAPIFPTGKADRGDPAAPSKHATEQRPDRTAK